MKRLILLCLLLASVLCAQMGSPVTATADPPARAIQRLAFYDASGNFQYLCRAVQNNVVNSWSIGSGLTNIVVSSNVATATFPSAHGLYSGARITVAGGAAALNATYTVATAPSTTSVTFATSGVSNGTYTTGLTVSTTNPLTVAPVWAIDVYTYSATGVWTGGYMAGGVTAYALKCDDRGNY